MIITFNGLTNDKRFILSILLPNNRCSYQDQARREATGGPGQSGHTEPPPPNLQIMAYAPKRVSFEIKAFKAF